MTGIKEINADQLNSWMESERQFKLLDIRTIAEIQQGILPGGEIQSMRELPAELHKYHDVDETIVVYCRSGIRSYQVCEFMQDKGYTNVYNLDGGIMMWADRGYQIDRYQPGLAKAASNQG